MRNFVEPLIQLLDPALVATLTMGLSETRQKPLELGKGTTINVEESVFLSNNKQRFSPVPIVPACLAKPLGDLVL